ncbi:MAG TPA: M23 family metallopeptidase [Methyloceanibacter sp.]|nr:M23 family metallopeptidase [Methyloceanibacter sp.]
MPSLGLTGSDESDNADFATTSALPVPQESVYSPGSGYDPRLQRTALPPPSYSPAPRPAPAPAYVQPQAKVQGQHIKVAKGDTLSNISRRYGVPVEQIISANDLPDGRLVQGQELVLPGVTAAKAAAVAKANKPSVRTVKTETIAAPKPTSLAEEEAADVDGGAAGGKHAASNAGNEPEPKANGIAASSETTGPAKRVASVDQLPAPDPMSGNSFRWPVKGRIIAGFGTKPDGGHNDGIDVAVPQGTSVKAAENGVVAYSGNELKGYGNLVLIRHANNWVSAYANNEELLVKRGDKVRRGQIIAKAGATGAVSQPQVHFELRKGSRPVDPTKHMSDQAANAE